MTALTATRMRDGEWEFRVGRAVAYGNYDLDGSGALTHSPSQSDMDRVAAALDEIEMEDLAELLRVDARRVNPHLMLVTGNPPKADILEAWSIFHQRDDFDGKWEALPDVRGVPKCMFVLGRCAEIDVGNGPQELLGGKVHLACDPSDESLWIVSRAWMNFSGAQGADVVAVVYEPPPSSGKEAALYKHDFSEPLPKLTPIGPAHRCRAATLEGGVFTVSDWIRS